MILCLQTYYATGRRKSASARVFIKKGNGEILINKKILSDYFSKRKNQMLILYPLKITKVLINELDIFITVRGGGITGQVGAISHGIARALVRYNQDLRNILRSNGLITRDSREVERKKVGLRKSRKRPQYSKR